MEEDAEGTNGTAVTCTMVGVGPSPYTASICLSCDQHQRVIEPMQRTVRDDITIPERVVARFFFVIIMG